MNIEIAIGLVVGLGLVAFLIVRRKKKAGVDPTPPIGPGGREPPNRMR